MKAAKIIRRLHMKATQFLLKFTKALLRLLLKAHIFNRSRMKGFAFKRFKRTIVTKSRINATRFVQKFTVVLYSLLKALNNRYKTKAFLNRSKMKARRVVKKFNMTQSILNNINNKYIALLK